MKLQIQLIVLNLKQQLMHLKFKFSKSKILLGNFLDKYRVEISNVDFGIENYFEALSNRITEGGTNYLSRILNIVRESELNNTFVLKQV